MCPKIGWSRGDAVILELSTQALAWAVQRGHRSGRVAWQFIEELAGAAGKRLAP